METLQIAEIIQQLLVLIGIVFGTDSEVAQTILAALTTLSLVVGSASVVVASVETIVKITPSDKDDVYVGKARRIIARVVAILDRLALNPDKTKARDKK